MVTPDLVVKSKSQSVYPRGTPETIKPNQNNSNNKKMYNLWLLSVIDDNYKSRIMLLLGIF